MGGTEAGAARAIGVRFVGQDDLVVDLTDGRQFLLWLACLPRLRRATAEQRANWRVIGEGTSICWDEVSETLSIRQVLGLPSDECRPTW